MVIRDGPQIYLIRNILHKQCCLLSTGICAGTHAVQHINEWPENGSEQWNKNLLMILTNWGEQKEGLTERNCRMIYETDCLDNKTEDEKNL